MSAFVVQFMDLFGHWDVLAGLRFWDLVFQWVLKVLLIFALLILKYVLGAVLAQVFSLKNVANIHNQDLINYLFWVFVLLIFITLGQYAFAPEGLSQVTGAMVLVITVAVLIFQLGIYFKLLKITSLNKMLIISYLCVTEFLPGFILIYLLSK
jgi:hypothetical protein